jgi:hypothetical protein
MLTYDTPAYMFNVHKTQLSWQTGSRNLTGPKTLPATAHLNFEETKVFTILVNSVDSGIPQMDVNDTINIVIQDVNDPPSDIIFSKYTVSTSHNS